MKTDIKSAAKKFHFSLCVKKYADKPSKASWKDIMNAIGGLIGGIPEIRYDINGVIITTVVTINGVDKSPSVNTGKYIGRKVEPRPNVWKICGKDKPNPTAEIP
ncbi:MAG: hypothetical protein KKF20_02975 [Bacteroidetes bacterium]|nr:hypothetical protein [Bacteroidota bacterium]MBU1422640.1 hypothetical protein [Bacteroidota bacterium]MBU2471353.1 hypothetical protein [Bacteroidota bacterium]MBU2635803.1 hypothetical protein [Bacteroidota bacterium]